MEIKGGSHQFWSQITSWLAQNPSKEGPLDQVHLAQLAKEVDNIIPGDNEIVFHDGSEELLTAKMALVVTSLHFGNPLVRKQAERMLQNNRIGFAPESALGRGVAAYLADHGAPSENADLVAGAQVLAIPATVRQYPIGKLPREATASEKAFFGKLVEAYVDNFEVSKTNALMGIQLETNDPLKAFHYTMALVWAHKLESDVAINNLDLSHGIRVLNQGLKIMETGFNELNVHSSRDATLIKDVRSQISAYFDVKSQWNITMAELRGLSQLQEQIEVNGGSHFQFETLASGLAKHEFDRAAKTFYEQALLCVQKHIVELDQKVRSMPKDDPYFEDHQSLLEEYKPKVSRYENLISDLQRKISLRILPPAEVTGPIASAASDTAGSFADAVSDLHFLTVPAGQDKGTVGNTDFVVGDFVNPGKVISIDRAKSPKNFVFKDNLKRDLNWADKSYRGAHRLFPRTAIRQSRVETNALRRRMQISSLGRPTGLLGRNLSRTR